MGVSIEELIIEKCDEKIHFYGYENEFENYNKNINLCLKPGQDLKDRKSVV